jgi:hypothetical protein
MEREIIKQCCNFYNQIVVNAIVVAVKDISHPVMLWRLLS